VLSSPPVPSEVAVLRAPRRFSLEDLARLARPHLEAAGVERAVVFGSYARGTADGYSDLDLAVVLRTDLAPLDRGPLLRPLLDALPVPVDLLVFTPDEWTRGLERALGVFAAIASEGKAIHERRSR
jgi:predicted nucleotidyltransferase